MEIEKYIDEKFKDLKDLVNARFDANDTEHQNLKNEINKKANKWTERAMQLGMTCIILWSLNQLLDMIPKAYTVAMYFINLIV